MDNEIIPPFYVGQRVVALSDHQQNAFKRNHKFTITSIRKSGCKCSAWVVTIGLSSIAAVICCNVCNTIYNNKLSEWLFLSTRFAPIHTDFQSITFKECIEIESPLIGLQ